MKKINLILAVSCLFLLSCEVDSIETIENPNANLQLEQQGNMKGPTGPSGPSASCPAFNAIFEHRLDWTAYLTGLALYQDATIIQELQDELDLNQYTKALRLTDLLGSNSPTPVFKQEFEDILVDIIDGVVSSPPLGGCPDDPAGGPDDDPNGGDLCANCDPFQTFMDAILVDNCVELYFPRGVYSGLAVDIATASHPLCNAYGNAGFNRTNCATVEEIPALVPNFVQTHEQTFIIARPYVDTSNSNCDYTAYSGIDFTFFLNGSWPLAN